MNKQEYTNINKRENIEILIKLPPPPRKAALPGHVTP